MISTCKLSREKYKIPCNATFVRNQWGGGGGGGGVSMDY